MLFLKAKSSKKYFKKFCKFKKSFYICTRLGKQYYELQRVMVSRVKQEGSFLHDTYYRKTGSVDFYCRRSTIGSTPIISTKSYVKIRFIF